MKETDGISVKENIVHGDLILNQKPLLSEDNVSVLEASGLNSNNGLRCLVIEDGIATPIFYTRSELEAAGVGLEKDSDVQRWSLVSPETDKYSPTLAPERRDPRRLVLATLQEVDPEGNHYDKEAAAQILSAQQQGAEARFLEFLQRQERRFLDYYRTDIEHRVSRDQWEIQAGVDGLSAIVDNLNSLSSSLPQGMAEEIIKRLQDALRKKLEADPQAQAELSYYRRSRVSSEQFRTDLPHGPFIEQLEGFQFVLPNGVTVQGKESEMMSYPNDSFYADWEFLNPERVQAIVDSMRASAAEYNRRNHG